jgi:CBS domain-containing protein
VLLVGDTDSFTPALSSSSRTKVSTVTTTKKTTPLFFQGRPRPSNQRSFINSSHGTTTTTPRRELLQHQSSSTSVDPEDVLPLASSTMTPEGYGFSSPIHRILKLSTSRGQYCKARASDSITEVMDGITNGVMPSNAALVFSDDDDGKLVGIFTETDYIKVRTSGRRNGQIDCCRSTRSKPIATYLLPCHPDTVSLFMMLCFIFIRIPQYTTHIC